MSSGVERCLRMHSGDGGEGAGTGRLSVDQAASEVTPAQRPSPRTRRTGPARAIALGSRQGAVAVPCFSASVPRPSISPAKRQTKSTPARIILMMIVVIHSPLNFSLQSMIAEERGRHDAHEGEHGAVPGGELQPHAAKDHGDESENEGADREADSDMGDHGVDRVIVSDALQEYIHGVDHCSDIPTPAAKGK